MSRKQPLPRHSYLINRFDQFCDYTSIVGFRLLRSENSIWLRLLTLGVFVGFSGMIVIQTREAFERFVNPASKPAPRFESFALEAIPRPGFVICFENQVASIMRGYGSTDFRMLLSEYAKDEPNLDRFNDAQMEFEMLERLLNGTPDETQINEIRSELKNFREISMLLDFSTFDADPNVLLILRGYRIFRRQQFGFDDCWHEHRQNENNREHFVECRIAKVRKRFDEFKFYNLNFFEYFYNVSMKFEDLAWNISLANTNHTHETYWHPEYGPCESIKPMQWEYSEDDLEDDMKDVLFIWTNYFESLKGSSSALFLSNPKQNALLNKIELYAGDYLEIELAGYEEFENELCSNRYPRVCSQFQRPSTNYSYAVCRWCDAWIRTCTCAVPQVYHPDITLRNCTFFESVNCTHRYKVASLKKSSCDPECKRQRFTINTRQQPLELELLPDVFESRVQEEFQQLTHSLNSFFEYPYDSTMKIFNTADELYTFLEAYFRLFQLIYRIGYGNNYTLPVVFAENNVDSPSLASFIDLNQSPLNTCGIPGLNVIIERFLGEYFRYFKSSSFQQFFNCTRSIPLTSCAQMLGNQTVEIPALLDLMESKNQMFERSSFELMVTTNGSINPAAFIRKYYIEDNMEEFVRVLDVLQSTAQVLKFALDQNFTFSNTTEFVTQIEDARSNVQKFLENEWINQTDKMINNLKQTIQKNNYLGMFDGFALRNMIMIEIRYVPFTKQRITYPADYNFWTFLAEFGGVLGLYFGVTIITIYETVVFFFAEPDEARVRVAPLQKLSKEVIYERENSSDYALAVPK